jgi:hypothetical protein
MLKRLLYVVLFINAPWVHADSAQVFVTSDVFSYTRSQPISDFRHDWRGHFQSSRSVTLVNVFATGVRNTHFGMSYLMRQHAYMKFAGDTAEFYYLTRNKKPLVPDKEYKIDLSVDYLEARGVRFFWQALQSSRVSVEFGATLLEGQRLVSGSLRGAVTPLNERDYQYNNVNLNYFYSKDILFDRALNWPQGYGYALDTQIHWQPDPRLRLQLDIKDIAAQIRWQQTPRTVARLTSDNKTYDENGYVRIAPAIQGQHLFEDYTQHLPAYVDFMMTMALGMRHGIFTQVRGFSTAVYPALGIEQKGQNDSTLRFFHYLNSKAFGVAYAIDQFYINLALDDLQPDAIRFVQLQLGLVLTL